MVDSALIDAAGDLLDDLGEPATYNGTDITVLVESYGQVTEQSPGVRVPDATIYVRGLDVPQPRKNDVVTWGGKSYRVVGDPEADGGRVAWKLILNRQLV